jgi:hypothetical protein
LQREGVDFVICVNGMAQLTAVKLHVDSHGLESAEAEKLKHSKYSKERLRKAMALIQKDFVEMRNEESQWFGLYGHLPGYHDRKVTRWLTRELRTLTQNQSTVDKMIDCYETLGYEEMYVMAECCTLYDFLSSTITPGVGKYIKLANGDDAEP